MKEWDDILKIALIGTERGMNPVQSHNALAETLAKVDTGDAETALLNSAAIVASYKACAFEPNAISNSPTEPAAQDSQAEAGTATERHLLAMLEHGEYQECLREWLSVCAQSGQRVSANVLPELLDRGRHNVELREHIIPVLGNRGRWLAGFNTDWSYAAAGSVQNDSDHAVEDWEEGTQATRVSYLKSLRRADPEKARELLQSVWSIERAKERAQLLGTFSVSLSAVDEPLLQQYLADKSKEVRAIATELLVKLPDSTLTIRLSKLALDWVRYSPKTGLMNKLSRQKGKLDILLPEEWDSALKQSGIVEKAPHNKGKKAWWLEQVMAMVPPSIFTEHWNVSAAEALELARASDWSESLIKSWTQAALLHQNAQWSEALMSSEPVVTPELWGGIPAEQQAGALIRILQGKDKKHRNQLMFSTAGIEGIWSTELTDVLAKIWLETMKGHAHPEHVHRYPLRTFAQRMAPQSLPAVEIAFSRFAQTDSGWQSFAEPLLDTIKFRIEMLNALDIRNEQQ